jgi:hypothetical protein
MTIEAECQRMPRFSQRSLPAIQKHEQHYGPAQRRAAEQTSNPSQPAEMLGFRVYAIKDDQQRPKSQLAGQFTWGGHQKCFGDCRQVIRLDSTPIEPGMKQAWHSREEQKNGKCKIRPHKAFCRLKPYICQSHVICMVACIAHYALQRTHGVYSIRPSKSTPRRQEQK